MTRLGESFNDTREYIFDVFVEVYSVNIQVVTTHRNLRNSAPESVGDI